MYSQHIASALLLVYITCISCGESAPTFGDEYVHIKLHVPKEAAANAHKNLQKLEHAAALPPKSPHKVIHHYHKRRRRPYKKSASHNKNRLPTDALVESIIVSEMKRPGISESGHLDHLNHANEITQHITILKEPSKSKKHVDTYTIVEETKKKLPAPHKVETIKVIESKAPVLPPPSYHHVETLKLIDTKEEFHPVSHHSHHHDYHVYHKPLHTETIKIIDSGYQYKHKKPHVDAVKVIESHAPTIHRYAHKPNRPHYEIPTKLVEHDYHYETKPESEYHSYKVTEDVIDHKTRPKYHYEEHTYDKVRPEIGYHYEKPVQYQHHYDAHHEHSEHQHEYSHHNHKDIYTEPGIVDAAYSPLDELDETPSKSAYDHYSSYHDDALASFGHGSADSDGYRYVPPTDIDWPGRGGSYSAVDTYNGVDSYSAPHVQGVDSDDYHLT